MKREIGKNLSSVPEAEPGHSIWIECGVWYTAPTVDAEKFGGHAYDGHGYDLGIRECPCGCHMGSQNSGGPVDPFGACPKNPKPERICGADYPKSFDVPALRDAVEKFLKADEHDLCHENRRELAEAFGLAHVLPEKPKTVEEFAAGCERYMTEIYGSCPIVDLRAQLDHLRAAAEKTLIENERLKAELAEALEFNISHARAVAGIRTALNEADRRAALIIKSLQKKPDRK